MNLYLSLCVCESVSVWISFCVFIHVLLYLLTPLWSRLCPLSIRTRIVPLICVYPYHHIQNFHTVLFNQQTPPSHRTLRMLSDSSVKINWYPAKIKVHLDLNISIKAPYFIPYHHNTNNFANNFVEELLLRDATFPSYHGLSHF